MSEQTDATEDRSDDEELEQLGESETESESDAEQPQPWAKALPGEMG